MRLPTTLVLTLLVSLDPSQDGPQVRNITVKQIDDNLRNHQQYPNDVQSSSNFTYKILKSSIYTRTKKPRAILPNVQQRLLLPNTCQLGNETFEIGDQFYPRLPVFGVQNCVLCNCVLRKRKGKPVTVVNCRRLSEDCIDLCPDGSKPVAGQCCESCKTENPH